MAQTTKGLEEFFSGFSSAKISSEVECAVFPTYTHLSLARSQIQQKKLQCLLGAQDCSNEKAGAFTGEVSAAAVSEIPCQLVLVGHSERRQRWKESISILSQKLKQALEANLRPVFCLGENLEERKIGQTIEVIRAQLASVQGLTIPSLIIAYEPVWAIGTGLTPTLKEVEEVHSFLWKECPGLRAVLYGGSVKPENARELARVPGVSGFLVGGASLKAADFLKIAESSL